MQHEDAKPTDTQPEAAAPPLTAQDATAPDGTAQEGTAQEGTAPDATAQDGTAQHVGRHGRDAPEEQRPERRWSRRGLLLGGAGAAAGAAASTIATATPAAAGTGTMQYGATNNAGSSATELTGNSSEHVLRVTNSSLGSAIVGVSEGSNYYTAAILGKNSGEGAGVHGYHTSFGVGVQAGSGSGTAVQADSNSGIGVYARSGSNTGLVAYSASRAPLHLQHAQKAAVPKATAFTAGMFYATDTGEVWLCVAGGTPGSWRLIAGPQAAGAYCPITPVRVYDSRWGTVPGLTTGALTNTTVRAIPTANGRNNTGAITTPDAIPAGARALTVNLTITGTINTGYIALVPGNQQTTTTSSINWTATGQTAANGLTVPLDPTNRTLNAICAASTTNATPGRTHIIIDVTGYYLGL